MVTMTNAAFIGASNFFRHITLYSVSGQLSFFQPSRVLPPTEAQGLCVTGTKGSPTDKPTRSVCGSKDRHVLAGGQAGTQEVR